MFSSGGDIPCGRCGNESPSPLWRDYFCPRCKAHNDALYREEHHDPEFAATLTRAGIIAEYRKAGIPFQAGDA